MNIVRDVKNSIFDKQRKHNTFKDSRWAMFSFGNKSCLSEGPPMRSQRFVRVWRRGNGAGVGGDGWGR